MQRQLDPNDLRQDEDWEGNNIAVTCPVCKKIYLISGAPQIHDGTRKCPNCGKSEGTVQGGRKSGGTASVSWSE